MTVRRNTTAAASTKAASKAPAAKAKAPAAKAAPVAGGSNVELKPVEPKSTFKLPKGYIWRYTRRLYDMARKVDASVEGADWFTVCNQHGTRVDAESGAECEENGRSRRAEWCPQCKAEAAAADKAAKAEAAKAAKAAAKK